MGAPVLFQAVEAGIQGIFRDPLPGDAGQGRKHSPRKDQHSADDHLPDLHVPAFLPVFYPDPSLPDASIEIKDELSTGEATEAHHIFSRQDFPALEAYLENLILLTPSQHRNKAHPGDFRQIDKEYQYICLITKSKTIKESVESLQDGFYSKDDFVYVLNTGIQTDHEFDASDTFETIENQITYAYHRS